DELALWRPDTDREDAHAPFLGAPDGGVEIPLVTLAVRDQDDRLVARFAPFEGVEAGVDGGGERRSPTRDDAHLDRVEALEERPGVQRQRTLEERGARERHQSEAVAARFVPEVADGALRPRQPVGLDVRGQHAARRVEGDHEVDALAPDLLPPEAPHGPG